MRKITKKVTNSPQPRHSWASIAVNVCGIAVEVVGRALGHSVGQRVTLIYARLDTAQVDAAVVAVSRAVGI